MEVVLDHLTNRWPIYVVSAVFLIPVLILTRKFSLPLILWTLEVCLYITGLHLFMYGLLHAAGWFKGATQMAWKEEDKIIPTWTVPLDRFWDRSLYDPHWIFWFELIVLIAMIGVILKFRPIKVQSPLPKREGVRKGVGATRGPSAKGPGTKGSSR
jgi:hypothetical protein